MAILKTCRSCSQKGECGIQDRIQQAVKGLSVITISHRCASHRAPYYIGQAVWAFVLEAPYDRYAHDDYYSHEGPRRAWFPGHFLGVSTKSNTRALVVIKSGAKPREELDTEFDPGNKKGICKVIWGRIEGRDGADEPLCPECRDIASIVAEGECHGNYIANEGACPLKQERAAA